MSVRFLLKGLEWSLLFLLAVFLILAHVGGLEEVWSTYFLVGLILFLYFNLKVVFGFNNTPSESLKKAISGDSGVEYSVKINSPWALILYCGFSIISFYAMLLVAVILSFSSEIPILLRVLMISLVYVLVPAVFHSLLKARSIYKYRNEPYLVWTDQGVVSKDFDYIPKEKIQKIELCMFSIRVPQAGRLNYPVLKFFVEGADKYKPAQNAFLRNLVDFVTRYHIAFRYERLGNDCDYKVVIDGKGRDLDELSDFVGRWV